VQPARCCRGLGGSAAILSQILGELLGKAAHGKGIHSCTQERPVAIGAELRHVALLAAPSPPAAPGRSVKGLPSPISWRSQELFLGHRLLCVKMKQQVLLSPISGGAGPGGHRMPSLKKEVWWKAQRHSEGRGGGQPTSGRLPRAERDAVPRRRRTVRPAAAFGMAASLPPESGEEPAATAGVTKGSCGAPGIVRAA